MHIYQYVIIKVVVMKIFQAVLIYKDQNNGYPNITCCLRKKSKILEQYFEIVKTFKIIINLDFHISLLLFFEYISISMSHFVLLPLSLIKLYTLLWKILSNRRFSPRKNLLQSSSTIDTYTLRLQTDIYKISCSFFAFLLCLTSCFSIYTTCCTLNSSGPLQTLSLFEVLSFLVAKCLIKFLC